MDINHSISELLIELLDALGKNQILNENSSNLKKTLELHLERLRKLPKVKLLIVERQPLISVAFRNILRSFTLINGKFNFIIDPVYNIGDAISPLKRKADYDLLIIDSDLPAFLDKQLYDSLDFVEWIKKQQGILSKIMIITLSSDFWFIDSALKRTNPDAFLTKENLNREEVIKAIMALLSGRNYYCPTVSTVIKESLNSTSDFSLDKIDKAILYNLYQGMTNKEIARSLLVSVGTVENRKKRMKDRWSLKTDGQLLIMAVKRGFIKVI